MGHATDCIRPNIAYVVGVPLYWNVVDHIVKYRKRTTTDVLMYQRFLAVLEGYYNRTETPTRVIHYVTLIIFLP